VVRIAATRLTPVRLRLAQPLRTGHGAFTDRPSLLLELRDRDGVAGYGEAAPWPGFGTETLEQAAAGLRAVEPLLASADIEPGDWPTAIDACLHDRPVARAALDGALWDLASRRAGRPLADHLADRLGPLPGPRLQRVAAGALLRSLEPDAVRREAARVRSAGYRAAKIKLGAAPLAEDIRRVRAARDGLGEVVALRGDANGAWRRGEAFEALEGLAEFGLDYVEQPLPADDLDGLAELRRRSPVRIAADESVATPGGARRVLAAAAADVLVLKPAMLGGSAGALRIAVRARAAGVGVVFSHSFESAIGAHHVLHGAAAWGDREAIHGVCTSGLFDADLAAPVECRAGMAEVAAEPGLGVVP